jgi:rhamnulose-1-phosphate aldolase
MDQIFNQNKKVRKIIQQVSEVAQYLWDRGWAERNAGNISVNINHLLNEKIEFNNQYPFIQLPQHYPSLANQVFFVTGTGKRMRDLARSPEQNALFIKISEDGSHYQILKDDPHEFFPTSELPTHLSIHQQIVEHGKNEKVILHAHVLELIALTHYPENTSTEAINKIIWSMHPETRMFLPEGIGFIPYTKPGSVEIAEKTLKAFENHRLVLWEKHGIFASGVDVLDAFDNLDIVSKSAKIWFLCKQAGFDPEGLSEKQINEII